MFQVPKIKFKKLVDDAELPYRKSVSDAGYILKSIDTKILPEKEYTTISTGLKVEDFVKGVWGIILPFEDLLEERKIQAVTYVLENNFRDELKITLYNASDDGYYIESGQDIAKLVFMPLLTIEPEFNNE